MSGGEAVPTYAKRVARILVIEDEQRLRQLLAAALAKSGHDVTTVRTAMEGLDSVAAAPPNAIVLDLGLPDLDGLELLKMLRAISRVPVIVATARSGEQEIVRLLDAGADDYVVKPFSAEHLEARIRAVLRRGQAEGPVRPMMVGELEIHPASRVARLAGKELELAPREFDLLVYLISRAGEVVSKRELLAQVWREPYGGGEKSIDVHLSWLRRKLGETATSPRYIRTVYGVGVKLVDPDA